MAVSGAELQFLIKMRDEASRIINQVTGAMGGLGSQSQQTKGGVRGVAMAMTELNQSLEVAKKGIDGFNRSFGEALATFRTYDKGMTIVRRTTEVSKTAIADFGQQFDEMVKRVQAVPIDRLLDVGGQAAQLGIKGSENIIRFTETIAKLESSLTDLGQDAPKLIVRVLNATGEGIPAIEKFGNVFIRMNKDASSSGERILQMTSLMAQATSQFKMGSESLLGLATAAADLNFQPELFGTAMSRTLTQLYEASTNNTQAMRDLSVMTGITAAQFREMIKTDPAMALITFTEAMKDVNASGRSVLSFLTGFNLQAEENRRVLGTVAENTGKFRENLAAARMEAKKQVAMNQEFGVTLEAFFAKTTAASNSWELFKKNLGAALAPVATKVLDGVIFTLDGLSKVLTSMPSWAQQVTAWSAVVVAAAAPVVLTIRAVSVAFTMLGGASAMSAVGSMVGGLVSIGGAALRAVASLSLLTRIGSIISMAVSAIAGLVSAIGAVPIAIGVAIAALVAAFAYGIHKIWQNWDALKAFFSQSWGEIGSQIVEMIGNAFTQAMAFAKQKWTEFWNWVTFNTGAEDRDAKERAELDKIFAARRELQEKLEALKKSATPNQDEIDAVSIQLERLTKKALQLTDVIARRDGYKGPDTDKMPVSTPDRPQPGVALTPKINSDVSVLSRISDENRKVIGEMDQYSKQLDQIKKQLNAIDQLRSLPKDDRFFKDMKLNPEEVDAYIARLQGLVDLERIRADAVLERLKTLGEETQAAAALTGEEKRALEIERAIREVREKKGALTDAETAKLREQLTVLQQQKTVTALREAGMELTKQTFAAAALTAEAKNRLEIIQRILDMEKEQGRLTEEQRRALASQIALLQNTRTAASFAEATRELEKQTFTARQLTRDQQNQAEVVLRILEFEREKGRLSDAQKKSLSEQVALLQQVQQFNTVRDQLDPIGTANRKFGDDMGTLNRALQQGTINLQSYNYMVEQLKRQTLDARDPFGAQVKSMREQLSLQLIAGDYMDADKQTLQQIIQLQDRGVVLTQQQVSAMSEYNRAMQDLKKSQESGLEGWARSIGSMRDNILDLQKSLMNSFSTQLVDTIYGTGKTWQEFLLGASKQITTMFVNQGLKELANGLGNSLNGLLPGLGVGDTIKKAVGAQSQLNSMTTAAMTVTATTVTLNGPVPGLGAGAVNGMVPTLPPAAGAIGAGQPMALSSNFNANIDAKLMDILKTAATRFDMKVEAFSGLRPGDSRFHGQGMAADVRLLGADGKAVPNYQDAAGFRDYERFAQEARRVQMEKYPELDKDFRWGGYFSGEKGKYGAVDTMHFDVGGRRAGMGGGSWEDGLTPQQREMWPGANSVGMGDSANQAAAATKAMADANKALADSAKGAVPKLQDTGNALMKTGTDGNQAGQQVQQAGNAMQQAGQSAQMAGTGAQMAGTGMTIAGTQATVAGTQVQQAGTSTQNLGTAAQTAAPAIDQAAASLRNAAASSGGGGAGGLGGLGSLFSGNFMTSLAVTGIGMLGSYLMSKNASKTKKTETITYSTPNRAVSRLHGGGLGGFESVGNMVDNAMHYVSAPRYHEGLKSDEFRAVLQRGERVLTERDTKRVDRVLTAAASGVITTRNNNGITVNMTVQANDVSGFKKSQNTIMSKTSAGLQRAAMRSL